MSDYYKTLEQFVQSDEFVPAIVSATQADYAGSGYSVELFDDGSWRILWDNQIGNLYVSPGIILGVPALSGVQHEDVNDENTLDTVAEFYSDEIADEMFRELEMRMQMIAEYEASMED